MEVLLRYWNRIRRGVLFFLVLMLFLLMQDVVLSHIALLGVRAMFLPALVVAVGHFEGGWRGGLFGLLAGVFQDLSGTEISLFFTLLYPLMGFVAGFLTEFLLNRHFYVYCLFAVSALFLVAFFQMFPLLLSHGENAGALWKTCILQTLWSIPYLLPAYYAVNALPKRLG